MKIKIYQIDAFTGAVFKGNPAAVCPLEEWLPDEMLQNIAAENNLAETAYYVRRDDSFEIRWFTPTVEVDLCGHATLASAYVVRNFENHQDKMIQFYSPRSGSLPVTIKQDNFILNFPTDQISEVDLTPELIATTNKIPMAAYKGKTDYMLVFENQEDILNTRPNLTQIANLSARGIIVTAKGDHCDFVSRFFAPASGVNEDPVTGSAHTTLTPYWAKRLGKNELKAIQISSRSGKLECRLLDERVEIAGEAVLYMKGEIYI